MVVLTRSRVRILVGTNFRLWVKNPLAVLAVRFGPHRHGPGFGDFSSAGKAVLLPLNKKRWGPFTPPAAFFC